MIFIIYNVFHLSLTIQINIDLETATLFFYIELLENSFKMLLT
jgi:hypothetical protein